MRPGGLWETAKHLLQGKLGPLRGVAAQVHMEALRAFFGRPYRARWWLASGVFAAGFGLLLWWLRNLPYTADPFLNSYLEIVGVLIAFTYAANALVRFRGTHERPSRRLQWVSNNGGKGHE